MFCNNGPKIIAYWHGEINLGKQKTGCPAPTDPQGLMPLSSLALVQESGQESLLSIALMFIPYQDLVRSA